MSFLVRAQDTDGRFAMVEYRARPGNEPPPHVHLWEHEIFSVLEGKMEFHVEDHQVQTVGPGETIFLPKGKAHAFYIRSEYLRTLIISLATGEHPAALDSYFASMSKPATSMNIPTNAVTYLTDDPSHAIELGAKYGIKILSPEEERRALPHFGGLGATSPRRPATSQPEAAQMIWRAFPRGLGLHCNMQCRYAHESQRRVLLCLVQSIKSIVRIRSHRTLSTTDTRAQGGSCRVL